MSNKRDDISILYMAVTTTAISFIVISTILAMKVYDVTHKCADLALRVSELYQEHAIPSASEMLETTMAVTEEPEPVVEPVEPIPETVLTKNEIDLIALVTMAEAEGEPEEGKRLVIDTILNRVDGKYWPDTVSDVVYQPNQFEAMWNGRVDRCHVREDIRELVMDELMARTDSEVVYFRTKRYSSYGTPLFQVGNHYFSAV